MLASSNWLSASCFCPPRRKWPPPAGEPLVSFLLGDGLMLLQGGGISSLLRLAVDAPPDVVGLYKRLRGASAFWEPRVWMAFLSIDTSTDPRFWLMLPRPSWGVSTTTTSLVMAFCYSGLKDLATLFARLLMMSLVWKVSTNSFLAPVFWAEELGSPLAG